LQYKLELGAIEVTMLQRCDVAKKNLVFRKIDVSVSSLSPTVIQYGSWSQVA